MGVNSSFSLLNNRFVAVYGSAFVMVAVLFFASSFTKRTDRDLRAKEINLIIREMGHRLLLQAGDRTSRVLPVTETKEGTFLLTFEKELVFNNDSLMVLSQTLLPKTQFPSGYTVTVHDCLKAGIVYGFQVSNTSSDVLPCKGRGQLPGCYTIEITFPDLYKNDENVEQKQAANDLLSVENKSITLDRLEANPKGKGFKMGIFDNPFLIMVFSAILVLLGITFLIGRFWKNVTPALAQHQSQVILADSLTEGSAIGKFLFDVKGQRLLLRNEVISLTEKEYKILELLNKNFGELIPRETLMKEIWLNEGVITGRSLDMFVSKLRKKLSRDPELRITNVHGKGYKLEITEM
jgi:hypothetical protein